MSDSGWLWYEKINTIKKFLDKNSNNDIMCTLSCYIKSTNLRILLR